VFIPVKKSRRVLRQPADVTDRFIADHADAQPVTWMCEALDVSASGYDAWAGRADRPAERRRQELDGAIEAVHADVRQRYGSPRMHAALEARGHACSENTVAKLMNALGIHARTRKRFVRTTDSRHRLAVAGNILARDFEPTGPDEAWCADITFVGTREGWLYLAVVEDLFSRRIVGWSMSDSMESRLVVDALSMAIARRRPGAGLLAHSDRGSQYASDHYQRVLAAEGIICGMSGVGQWWDNAPVEGFFGRMKGEIAGSDTISRNLIPDAVIASAVARSFCGFENRQLFPGSRMRCSTRRPKRGPRSSSLSKCSRTASGCTRHWGTCPRSSTNRRTTKKHR
jgi:putative transposase